MSLLTIINEFQNYSINKSDLISNNLNNLNIANNLDTNNLNIREYLLNEILLLTNKSLLNRFSADVLFQNNYWSWGIVTTYYSNFFLVQALNRLKGNFFTYIPSFAVQGKGGRRYIYLDNNDCKFKLTSCPSGYTDSHGGELKKFKDNYAFLLLNPILYGNFTIALSSNYPEATIRNNINYQLNHFKEFNDYKFKNNFDFETCKNIYDNYKNLSMNSLEEDFKMLPVNRSRLNLIFYIFKEICKINPLFEVEFDKFVNRIQKQISYKYKNDLYKYLFNKYNSEMKFHPISEILKFEIKGLLE